MRKQSDGVIHAFRVVAGVLVFLAVAGGPAWLAAAQDTAAAIPARIDPKAQQTLDRVTRALGGPAFLQFKRMTTKGRIYSIRDDSTSGFAPFESYVEYPDKRRFSYGKNPPVILINNGDQAYELDRLGVTSQSPEQMRRWRLSSRYSLENLLRLRIHEAGVLVQQGGVDFVDNVATQAVEIVDTQQTQVKLDLNRQTVLPVRISYRVYNSSISDWDDFSDVYSDYREEDGVVTPMHIARFLNDERYSEVYRSYAHYNDDYPSTYFQPVQ